VHRVNRHAVEYTKHGADVVVTDICENVDTNPYDLGTREQLEDTAATVEEAGGESLVVEMDVRDEVQVEAAVEDALEKFGRIGILANNDGIFNASELVELGEQQWDEMLDTNLKGVWLC